MAVSKAKRGRTPRSDIPSVIPSDTASDTGEAGASIFDRMGDDSYAVVWWVDPAGKHRAQFQVAPHLLSEEYIQSLVGGGEYVIREKVPDPDTGRMEWGRQRRILIDGPHKALTSIPVYQPKKGGGPNPPAPSASGVPGRVDINDIMSAGILNLFKAQQDATESIVRSMQPRPGMDVEKILVLLAPTLEKLASGLMARREEKSQAMTLKELADTMKTMKEAAGTPTNPATEFLDMIKKVLGVRRLMDDTVGDRADSKDDDRSPMERIAETYLPPLLERMNAMEPTKERPRRGATPVAAKAEPPKKLEGPVYDIFLATQKKRLLALATRARDAETIALGDYESLPDSYRGPLKAWLSQEDVFADIMQKNPEFVPFQEWFAKYFETLHVEFFPEEYTDDEDDEPTTEDYANGSVPPAPLADEPGPGRPERLAGE